ncbi:hypothetical protein [Bacillus safensis]
MEGLFSIDIKYYLKIDCEVKANGFRETLLRNLLKQKNRFFINRQ